MVNAGKRPTFLENVDMMVSDTINAIDVDPNIAKILQTCRSTLQVKFPVKIKGKIEIFLGGGPYTVHIACLLRED